MPIQKIIANNSSEGLKRISDEFGDDALILKTVKRNGRIEFFVEATEQQPTAPEPIPEPIPGLGPERQVTDQKIQSEYREARLKMLSAIAEQVDTEQSAVDLPLEQDHFGRRPIRKIQSELTVSRLLDALELTPGVAARLRDCKRIDEVTANLALMIGSEAPVTNGIFAFVGPAGSGKTTSLMKIIVNHIVNYGENSCAIINCDHHSVGAMDRMQRFGELVGVDVLQAGQDRNLNQAIAGVAKRQLVVIDTPGLGPKSAELHENLASISRSHYEISRLLVLPANLQFASMQLARQLYAGKRLSSCIATRMDEVASCGAILSFLAHSELPLRYLATGPRIPEDLVAANIPDLIHTSLSLMDQEFAKQGLSDLTKEGMTEKAWPNQRQDDSLVEQTQKQHGLVSDKVMDL